MICIDASVAVKWILEEEYTPQARALIGAAIEQQEPMIAPTLLTGEVTNTLRQRQRNGQLKGHELTRRCTKQPAHVSLA